MSYFYYKRHSSPLKQQPFWKLNLVVDPKLMLLLSFHNKYMQVPILHVSIQIKIFLSHVVPDWPCRVAEVRCSHWRWCRVTVNKDMILIRVLIFGGSSLIFKF